MPVPQYRAPKDSQPWGLLGAIGRFLSPPGYAPSGPFAQASARAAASRPEGGFNLGRPAAAAIEPSMGRQGPTRNVYEQPGVGYFDRSSGRFLGGAPAAPQLPGPTPIVRGTRDGVTPDRTQSDEYKAQMAQYGALQKAKKFEEADKLGMEIWQQKYGKTPLGQPGGAIGTKNPLMEGMPSFVSTPSNVVAGQNMPTPGYSTESNLSIAANAVPAPWYTQGAKVSSDFAGVVPAQASKTTGEGMPPLQTTGQTAGQKVTDFLIKLNELKGLF